METSSDLTQLLVSHPTHTVAHPSIVTLLISSGVALAGAVAAPFQKTTKEEPIPTQLITASKSRESKK